MSIETSTLVLNLRDIAIDHIDIKANYSKEKYQADLFLVKGSSKEAQYNADDIIDYIKDKYFSKSNIKFCHSSMPDQIIFYDVDIDICYNILLDLLYNSKDLEYDLYRKDRLAILLEMRQLLSIPTEFLTMPRL